MPDLKMPGSSPLKIWLKSSHLVGAAGLLAAVVLTLSLAFIRFERSEKEFDNLAQLQQLAKLMGHQTAADISAVESMLLVFATSNRDLVAVNEPGQLDPLVASVARGYPQLRSVSLINDAGRVLASTSPKNVDAHVDFEIFGGVPQNENKVTLGRILAGRDLPDIQPRAPETAKLNVLPMLLRLNTPDGQRLTLVALMNADYFSSVYEASANDSTVRIALLAYQGELLVATSNVELQFGSALNKLALFTDYLPKKEWGSYVGAGFDDPHVSTAFSTLPHWPMVIVAESSYKDAMRDVIRLERWTLITVLATLMVIAALTFATSASMRRHAVITQQLHSEVYASEARNKAVLESAIDAVITIDSAGVIVAFNRAAEVIFGYDREECLGRKIEELLVPRSLRSNHQSAMQRYFESGDGPVLKRLNHRIETFALRSDGSVFPVEMSNVEVKVDGVTYFTTNVRDISVARKAAAELDTTLSHYQELADALELQKQGFDHHAIVSISDAEEKIVYANDKLIEILGYSREELIGRKYYEFRQRLPQDVYQGLRSSLAEGHVWHGELAMRRRDGSKYWVSNTSVPIFDEKGAIKQYITVQTDISDLRQTEIDLALARARELEVGALIQQSLLAANPIKDMAGLWMTAYNQPSKGMDGDFVEVIRMGEHCLDILAGDVMGKGSLAGLMGAGTKLKFIRSIVELLAAENRGTEPPPPAAIVASMHKTMTPHLQELEAFVTLVYVRIDTLRNVITWIGCGHEETLIVRANGDLQTLSNQHPPLGILDHDDFRQDETHLGVGDAVFLCSDGLSDAVGPDGQRVGRDLVNQAVRQLIPEHRAPAAILHALRLKVLHKGVHVTDDVTMVLVLRTSDSASEARCELPIEMDSLRAAREFVLMHALRAGMPEQDASLFTVASIEIFTNVVRHGKGLLDYAPVELLVRCTPADFVLDIVHLGDAFVPPDEEVETDFAAFPEGGFGLTIIRHACDRVDFLHHDGVNTVRMRRRIET